MTTSRLHRSRSRCGLPAGLIALALATGLLAPVASSRAATVITTGSGSWSSTVPDAPWPGGVLPGPADDVVIASGDAVTIDLTTACANLTVGTSASLVFEAATPRTLTVNDDLTIANDATLASAATGTVTGHVLIVGGSVTNVGTLDLSTNGNTAGADLRFTGAASATFSGSGPTNDVRTLTIDKGSSSISVLELGPDHFTVQGSSGDATGFLSLVNGTLRVAGTFALTNRFFPTAGYTIPATAGFWLDNPNVNVSGQNASVTNNGLLQITQGTYNVGTASGRSIGAGAGARFVIDGGALIVAGRLASTQPVSYAQSSGFVNVAMLGNGSSNVGSFDLGSVGSSFTISGGTILIRQASSAANPLDYRVAAGTAVVTGGTLQLGDGSTVTRYNYHIAGAVPTLVIDNTIHSKVATLWSSNPETRIYGNVVINAGTTLDLNGYTLLQLGASINNLGSLNGTAPGSDLQFAGAGAQGYAGSGTVANPLDGLTVDNPAGVTLGGGAAIPVIGVDLVRGLLTNSSLLVLGSGGISGPYTRIGAPGLGDTGGSYDSAPAFNPGSGGYSVFYAAEAGARVAGFEIPPSRTVRDLTIGNANGVSLAGGSLTVTDTLALAAGNVDTGTDTLILGPSALVARTSGHVIGRFRKPVAAGAPAVSFEIGSAADYTPIDLAFSGVTVAGTVTASTTPGDHPSLGSSGINPALSVNRFWTLASDGVAFGSCNATFHFVPADVDAGADPAQFAIERFSSPTWFALAPGARTATSTQATGLASFGDFAVGMPSSSIYTIDVTVVGDGTVTKNPDQATYPAGAKVTLQATPKPGSHFVGWSGDAGGSDSTISVVTDSNLAVTATFAANAYTLTVSTVGGGVVTKNPDQASYGYGASVELTATPAPDQRFAGWSGDATGSTNPLNLIMNGDKHITATFVEAHAPKVQVTYPNGGELLVNGLDVDLTWSAVDNVGVASVSVLLSRTGAAGPYDTLATGLPNTGGYRWVVNGPLTNDAFIGVIAYDSVGNSGADLSDAAFQIVNPPTAVGSPPVVAFGLSPAAPNPTRGPARIEYTVPIEARIRLSVIDLQGREVAVLADELRPPGRYQATWQGAPDRLPSAAGIYFVRLQVPGRTFVRRVVLTR